ncbi:MAG: Mrp/NBP35 family ATP-binding protein [Microthrixaceae bacterium]|nr:Mrp/NBP35 family ATP-binding protein [Microthrixaceae bacterium]
MDQQAPAPSPPTDDDVMQILRGVIDPELGSNIVELGMAKGVTVRNGDVVIELALTTLGCPLRAQIKRDVESRVGSLPGVDSVEVEWGVLTQEEKAATMARARKRISERAGTTAVPPTARVLMIASGKGGVGKSSITVNLAAALAAEGFRVGLIDADIWGWSVPRMLGLDGRLEGDQDTKRIRPMSLPIDRGRIDVVSMGLLVDRDETALMWRGLILQRAVQHFLEDVVWAEDLDYLLIDMPPGTGDVQMGLAKLLPRAEMIVVTTPSRTAQKVASRAVAMGRQNYLRVLGVVENMTEFVSPSGERFRIFGSGGGEELASSSGTPLLARIPIEAAVSEGGDAGRPAAVGTGPAADAFRDLARRIITEVAPPIDMTGCSARNLGTPKSEVAVRIGG